MPSLDPLPIHRLPLVFDGADCQAVGISRHQLTRLVASPVVETVGPRLCAEAVRWLLADRVERHRALARHAPGRFTGSALSHESAAV